MSFLFAQDTVFYFGLAILHTLLNNELHRMLTHYSLKSISYRPVFFSSSHVHIDLPMDQHPAQRTVLVVVAELVRAALAQAEMPTRHEHHGLFVVLADDAETDGGKETGVGRFF